MNTPKPIPEEILHNKKEQQRFWKKVAVKGHGECWEWNGCRNNRGYGKAWVCHTGVLASRVAYFMKHGQLPTTMFVLHHCDNPPCCNPAHLFTGTQKDNTDDMWAKGRGVRQRGESSGMAKLTNAQVLEIRSIYDSGVMGSKRIAKRFGITSVNVMSIVKRETWTHI